MSSTPGIDTALTVAAPATPSPSLKAFDFDYTGSNYEMDPSISEEERRFYIKMYPTVDVVNQRKVHCTVCRMHIGTAVSTENNIKMHPILRVTHCIKCHDFYNSGEFSKGEDGSELYCRWCGQGGEVYCCSTCPFVFCKSCIIKNLSRGVIVDIEQNENWNCFKCTSKILWPLRAQHWALVNYIQTQKNGLQSLQLSESEMRRQMHKDYSTCCRLAKAKVNSLSDSMESLESNTSKRSHTSSGRKSTKPQGPPAKRPKSSNDDIVCTPDLLSMLEPDCQISVAAKPAPRASIAPASGITTTPRIVTVQHNYTGPRPSTNGSSAVGPRSSVPPPLVLSSSGMRYRQPTPPNQNAVVRRTVVPNAIRSAGPVFHTINGFRVDLNSAAQQDSYRLPNGRLIQVKRQFPPGQPPPTTTITRAPVPLTPQVIIRQQQPAGQTARLMHPSFGSNMGIYNPQTNQQQRAPQVVRVNNGGQMHTMNVTPQAQATAGSGNSSNGGAAGAGTTIMMTPASGNKPPTLVRHVFPSTPLGAARTQLQNQIFSAMEICTHLTGKVQTLTMSNAYNEARSYMDVKELYIHLSYLMTYAIGRFKQLQEKCLLDMREMGFKNDANSLENGQLAADKQASDDEDNEIEIVEPKTDTITIDSDNEEEVPSVSKVNLPKGLKITSVKSTAPEAVLSKMDPVTANIDPNMDIDVAAFSSSILASLLEVDITEGTGEVKTNQSSSPGGTLQKKQPRKKTTNKPNPALLQLERQRMEEVKSNDSKLRMKAVVKLVRAEEQFEVARKWIEACNQELSEKQKEKSEETESHKETTEEQAEASDINKAKSGEQSTDKEQKQPGEEDEGEMLQDDELLEPIDTNPGTDFPADETRNSEEDVDKSSTDNENLNDVEDNEMEIVKNQNVETVENMEEDTEDEPTEAKKDEEKEEAEDITTITDEAANDIVETDNKNETADAGISEKELDDDNMDEPKDDTAASDTELDKQINEGLNTEKIEDAASTIMTMEIEDAASTIMTMEMEDAASTIMTMEIEDASEENACETELAMQAIEEADKTEAQTDEDNTEAKAKDKEKDDDAAAAAAVTNSSSQPDAGAAEIPASNSPAKDNTEQKDELEDLLDSSLGLQYDCSALLD